MNYNEGDGRIVATEAPVSQTKPLWHGSPSSITSPLETEAVGSATYTQKNLPQQEQKGRRLQLNRQEQAAARERRTEYIKQLEGTIKHHEETLQNLQNSHSNIMDERLMLRYNNSLFERILLERDIDV